jgi:hypothetical protein
MKYIKLFENDSTETEISIPDVIEYFTKDGKVEKVEMQEFIHKLFIWSTVKFNCESCVFNNEHGATATAHMGKTHKGKITGFGYGFNDDYGQKKMHLTFTLKRIRYSHEVNTLEPIIIYGELPNHVKKTLDEINMNRDIKRYNL